MKSQSWRLIDIGPLNGPQNMAIDESLLCSFNPECSEPILRIYGWYPPALSLGRFQRAEDVIDLERCRSDSLQVIRRISGGGVIYHADELTYSVVCSPEQILRASTVKESFRILTNFLINFYRSLGLNASYALDSVSDVEKLGERTAFCFAGKESYDILIDGKKIGGNAQRRKKNVIFQHGSIPILNRARTGLEYMKDCTAEYAAGTTSLNDCSVSMDLMLLKHKLVESFKRHMCADLHVSLLSNEEFLFSEQLIVNKYTTNRWNLQGDIA